MALKYPDRLESNNPQAYGIVKAIEVTGHKTVNTKQDLLSISDSILSDSKINSNNDAIGQQWYVYSEKCFYQLIDWGNRKEESGWKKILTDTSLNESIASIQSSLDAHKSNTSNPHSVTKVQVGLGNVDNTSDLNKPISTATQTKLDTKVDKVTDKSLVSDSEITKLSQLPNKATLDSYIANAKKAGTDAQNNLNTHIANKENPHEVTKTQVGLSNVTNDAQVKRSEMGTNNGVATLDDSGKILTSQLPSFVDDVIEAASKSTFPTKGESGKIYVALDTNLTYRWGGTEYVEISKSLALGETSSTAYAGDKGKQTTDNLNSHLINYLNPHQVTKSQVGLGNVDNTSDVNKPISTATQNALNNKVNKVSGKQLSTEDYTTAEKQKLSSLQNYNDKEIRDLINQKMNIQPTELYNENLDNILTPGFYYAIGDNNVINKPNAADAFSLRVYRAANGYWLQELRDTVDKQVIFTRTYSTLTAWTTWELLPSTFIGNPINNQVLLSTSEGRLKSSGFTIAKSVPADAKFTDTIYNDTEIKNELKVLKDKFSKYTEIEITYSELMNLVKAKTLSFTNSYIITDFQCIYNIDLFTKDGDIVTSPNIYKIRVFPISNCQIHKQIEFVDHPEWEAEYRLEYKGEYAWETPTQKGFITYFKDGSAKSRYFFREIKTRKYKITKCDQIPELVGKYYCNGFPTPLPNKDGTNSKMEFDKNDFRDFYVVEDINGYAANKIVDEFTIPIGLINYGLSSSKSLLCNSVLLYFTEDISKFLIVIQNNLKDSSFTFIQDSSLPSMNKSNITIYLQGGHISASGTGSIFINSGIHEGYFTQTGLLVFNSTIFSSNSTCWLQQSTILNSFISLQYNVNQCYINNFTINQNKQLNLIKNTILDSDSNKYFQDNTINEISNYKITNSISKSTISYLIGDSITKNTISGNLNYVKCGTIQKTNIATDMVNVAVELNVIMNVNFGTKVINNTKFVGNELRGLKNRDLSNLDLSSTNYKIVKLNSSNEEIITLNNITEIGQKVEIMENNGNALTSDIKEGKKLIADAITKKGIVTNQEESFITMAKNIEKIPKSSYDELFSIEIDNNLPSPAVKRIGTPYFPDWLENNVQNIMVKDGAINYKLDRKNSLKKNSGLDSVIDGTDGDIMIKLPKFWYHMIRNTDGIDRFTFSETTQATEGWIESPEIWVGSTGMVFEVREGKDIARSCFNMAKEFRGGRNEASWDELPKSLLGMQRTAVSRDAMRVACTNIGTFDTGDYHNFDKRAWGKLNLMFMCIYGTRNWQADFSGLNYETGEEKRNSEGFKYGGLGRGIVDCAEWLNSFNGSNPFIKTNAGLELGCRSGISEYVLNTGTAESPNIIRLNVPVFLGIVNPFGHIWTAVDGLTKEAYLEGDLKKERYGIFNSPKKYVSSETQGASKIVERDFVISGWIKRIDEDLLPEIVGGSESTYFCGYLYSNSPGNYSIWTGGSALYGGDAGLWCVNSSGGVGLALSDYGGRLCFSPS